MKNNSRVLILGGSSQIGQEILFNQMYNYSDCYLTNSDECDITLSESINENIKKRKPHLIMNFAAYTGVDDAENEPEKAFAVNAEGCKNLAQICSEREIRLIHISTDYVFDGNINRAYSETDIANPLGVYGASKLAGENAIIRSGVKGAIIRTSWLYSAYNSNFVKTILRKASSENKLQVVDDQIGTPTWTADLAHMMYKLIQSNNFGKSLQLYHFSNEGVASWYDFACAVKEYAKLETIIHPVPTCSYPTICKRPIFTVLSKEKIKREIEIVVPHWRESLRKSMESSVKVD